MYSYHTLFDILSCDDYSLHPSTPFKRCLPTAHRPCNPSRIHQFHNTGLQERLSAASTSTSGSVSVPLVSSCHHSLRSRGKTRLYPAMRQNLFRDIDRHDITTFWFGSIPTTTHDECFRYTVMASVCYNSLAFMHQDYWYRHALGKTRLICNTGTVLHSFAVAVSSRYYGRSTAGTRKLPALELEREAAFR
jgi:hypothetical protein